LAFLHVPELSQALLPVQGVVALESTVPMGTFSQVPFVTPLQVLQAAVHASAQQTPSWQIPLEHSPGALQPEGSPFGFRQKPTSSHK